MAEENSERKPRSTPWRLLLLVPFVATLWVPFFNHAKPVVLGFPFFYWYQLAWVVISSVIIWIVWRAES